MQYVRYTCNVFWLLTQAHKVRHTFKEIPMDSYVRPLIHKIPEEHVPRLSSHTHGSSRRLYCPLAFFMWIFHMIYSIHRKHNSIFSFFEIPIIKSILEVFPTTNPTAIGRRMSLWYQTLISAQGIDLRKTTVSSQGIELRTEDLRIKTTYLPNKPPILATEATGCDRAWDRTEHPQDILVLWSAHREKKIKYKHPRTAPPTCP